METIPPNTKCLLITALGLFYVSIRHIVLVAIACISTGSIYFLVVSIVDYIMLAICCAKWSHTRDLTLNH